MKNVLFTILFASVIFVAKAQDSTVVLSSFEKMASTTGNFYRFEEKPIGILKGQNITVVKMSNFTNSDTVSVIRIAPNFLNTVPVIGNSVLYIQKEDIAPVIKLLEFYAAQLKDNLPVAGPYFSYITSNDIQLLCRYEEHTFSDSYLTIRKLYQHLRTPVQFSSIYFNNKKDIVKLIQFLKDAASEI